MSNTPNEERPEKKIFVDEDWKSRVEAERATARQPCAPEAAAETGPAAEAAPAATRSEADDDRPLPPPDLMLLATTFYMQALIGLGGVPDPVTRKAAFRPNHARHAIDSLQVLQEKTEGNRTAEESEALEAMLHQLRMAFVGAMQAAGTKK